MSELGHEVPDDGEQVGVAGPLAVAVGGALHVRRARLDGGDRVGHRAAGVVLAVDAEPEAGAVRRPRRRPRRCRSGSMPPLVSHSTATSAPASTAASSTRSAVSGSNAVAVEEVLGVEEDPPALGRQEGDGVGDHRAVLGDVGAQRPLDVPAVGLRDQRDDRAPRVQQRPDLRVVARPSSRPCGSRRTRRARRAAAPARRPRRGRRTRCPWACAPGQPPSMKPDPQRVEVAGDGELVGHRVADPLPLGAVAQRRVVDVEGVAERGAGRVGAGGHRGSWRGRCRATKKTPRGCERSARRLEEVSRRAWSIMITWIGSCQCAAGVAAPSHRLRIAHAARSRILRTSRTTSGPVADDEVPEAAGPSSRRPSPAASPDACDDDVAGQVRVHAARCRRPGRRRSASRMSRSVRMPGWSAGRGRITTTAPTLRADMRRAASPHGVRRRVTVGGQLTGPSLTTAVPAVLEGGQSGAGCSYPRRSSNSQPGVLRSATRALRHRPRRPRRRCSPGSQRVRLTIYAAGPDRACRRLRWPVPGSDVLVPEPTSARDSVELVPRRARAMRPDGARRSMPASTSARPARLASCSEPPSRRTVVLAEVTRLAGPTRVRQTTWSQPLSWPCATEAGRVVAGACLAGAARGIWLDVADRRAVSGGAGSRSNCGRARGLPDAVVERARSGTRQTRQLLGIGDCWLDEVAMLWEIESSEWHLSPAAPRVHGPTRPPMFTAGRRRLSSASKPKMVLNDRRLSVAATLRAVLRAGRARPALRYGATRPASAELRCVTRRSAVGKPPSWRSRR